MPGDLRRQSRLEAMETKVKTKRRDDSIDLPAEDWRLHWRLSSRGLEKTMEKK